MRSVPKRNRANTTYAERARGYLEKHYVRAKRGGGAVKGRVHSIFNIALFTAVWLLYEFLLRYPNQTRAKVDSDLLVPGRGFEKSGRVVKWLVLCPTAPPRREVVARRQTARAGSRKRQRNGTIVIVAHALYEDYGFSSTQLRRRRGFSETVKMHDKETWYHPRKKLASFLFLLRMYVPGPNEGLVGQWSAYLFTDLKIDGERKGFDSLITLQFTFISSRSLVTKINVWLLF